MNNTGNVNTILLVVLVVIVVGAGIWWYMAYGPGAPEPETASVQVDLVQSGE